MPQQRRQPRSATNGRLLVMVSNARYGDLVFLAITWHYFALLRITSHYVALLGRFVGLARNGDSLPVCCRRRRSAVRASLVSAAVPDARFVVSRGG